MRFLIQIIIIILATTLAAKASFSPISTDPANNDSLVARNPVFTLDFSHNACWYMFMAYVKNANDDSTIDTLTMANLNGDGTSRITLSTNVTLASNTAYYLDLPAAALHDCDPSYSNVNNYTRVDFTTGACTGSGTCCYNPPSCIGPCFGNYNGIKHLSPPDNGHFMQSYEGIGIVFNGNVTIGTGNIIIRRYSDDVAFETINVNSVRITGWGTDRIKIDPIGNLADNTQYYINFDIEGWSLTGNKDKWNFWTKSTPNSFSGSGL